MPKKTFSNSSIWPAVSIASLFVIWQLFSYFGLLNENLLPGPYIVATKIYSGILNGSIISDISNSLRRVFIGFFIGSILGFVTGLLCSFNRMAANSIKPLVELIRPIPPIAWIPLSILWFGFGEPSAYFLVSLGAFFPLFSSTFLGISQINAGTVEVAKLHGADNKILFRKIILPQALPSIFSGLKTGLGVSWMIVITAELVGVQNGLGYFIQVSRAQLQTEQVIAGMIIIGFIGLFLNSLLSYIGRKMMPWKWREKKIGTNE